MARFEWTEGETRLAKAALKVLKTLMDHGGYCNISELPSDTVRQMLYAEMVFAVQFPHEKWSRGTSKKRRKKVFRPMSRFVRDEYRGKVYVCDSRTAVVRLMMKTLRKPQNPQERTVLTLFLREYLSEAERIAVLWNLGVRKYLHPKGNIRISWLRSMEKAKVEKGIDGMKKEELLRAQRTRTLKLAQWRNQRFREHLKSKRQAERTRYVNMAREERELQKREKAAKLARRRDADRLRRRRQRKQIRQSRERESIRRRVGRIKASYELRLRFVDVADQGNPKGKLVTYEPTRQGMEELLQKAVQLSDSKARHLTFNVKIGTKRYYLPIRKREALLPTITKFIEAWDENNTLEGRTEYENI